MHMGPCMALASMGDYATMELGLPSVGSALGFASTVCNFRPNGTGPKSLTMNMSAGSGGGGRVLPRFLHPKSTMSKASLTFWGRQNSEAIVESLTTGRLGSLNVGKLIMKPNGVIMNGNTRVKILQDRGFDLMKLWGLLD